MVKTHEANCAISYRVISFQPLTFDPQTVPMQDSMQTAVVWLLEKMTMSRSMLVPGRSLRSPNLSVLMSHTKDAVRPNANVRTST